MNIVDIVVRVVVRKYDGTIRNTLASWHAKTSTLIFVKGSDGSTGVGEAWCERASPEVLASFVLRDLKPRLIGVPLDAIERIWRDLASLDAIGAKGGFLYAAIAGIDIALWDLLGKATGKPLYRLLGAARGGAPVYASGGMYGPALTPDVLAAEFTAAVRAGAGGAKMKVAGASVAEDVARVRAVRQAIGPDLPLMADAMFVPTVGGAIRLARALAEFNLHFLEAPTAIDDPAGWCQIKAATHAILSGPELLWGLASLREWIERGAVDILQFDLAIVGGISEGRRIAAMAAAWRRPISLHASGSAVNFAAAAHLAAAIHNADSVEFHLMHQALFDRLWSAGWRLADGTMFPPGRPGLGLDLSPDDPELIELTV